VRRAITRIKGVAVPTYNVYILSNASGTLYTGATNDLMRRVHEHKSGRIDSFTSRYKVRKLVYFETTTGVRAAIEREKEIKGWRREKKVRLIEASNPSWKDLAEEW
jgi:putative endonuclease